MGRPSVGVVMSQRPMVVGVCVGCRRGPAKRGCVDVTAAHGGRGLSPSVGVLTSERPMAVGVLLLQ